jgi:hypothetical protein
MSLKNMLFTCSVIILMVLFSGCTKYPEANVQNAEQALEDIKSLEGDRYLADAFNALQDSLNTTVAELNVQREKSVFKRDYSKGKEILQTLIEDAEILKSKIGPRKEELKAETDQIIIDYKAAHEDVKKLILKLPKNKNTKAAVERKKIELNSIESEFQNVSDFIDAKDFVSAKETASSANVRIQALKKELSQNQR